MFVYSTYSTSACVCDPFINDIYLRKSTHIIYCILYEQIMSPPLLLEAREMSAGSIKFNLNLVMPRTSFQISSMFHNSYLTRGVVRFRCYMAYLTCNTVVLIDKKV
jgi:hypothetical protein